MKIISITVTVRSAVLCMGTIGSCPVVPRANEPYTNLCMLYTAWFLMFKHSFCWKYQYKKYMFNFIDHLYSFISVSVCIDRGLCSLLWPGPILLIRRPWPYVIHHLHFMNIGQYCLCLLVVLIDIFVIKLFSYDLKDHTFILQTPASTTPFITVPLNRVRQSQEKSGRVRRLNISLYVY
jgi:hypothetical protein